MYIYTQYICTIYIYIYIYIYILECRKMDRQFYSIVKHFYVQPEDGV